MNTFTITRSFSRSAITSSMKPEKFATGPERHPHVLALLEDGIPAIHAILKHSAQPLLTGQPKMTGNEASARNLFERNPRFRYQLSWNGRVRMVENQKTNNLVADFASEFASCWQQLPDKAVFLLLLAAWLPLFHFLGNSTFGYVHTSSLFHWMWNAYISKHPAADDGHGTLIPFVVLALFWWKRKDLLAQPFRSWSPALILVAGCLVLHVLGNVLQQPRLSILGLFGGLYGLMGLVWGPQFLRACFFPFFLFGFMMPLGSLTEPVTFPLRLLVSRIVAFFCNT